MGRAAWRVCSGVMDFTPDSSGTPADGAAVAGAATYGGVTPRLYDVLMWPAEKLLVGRWRRRLYGAAASAPGARLLEIGAGTGAGFPYFAPGAEVTAVEPSAAMAARARARAGAAAITIVEARAEALPFADASFDRAVATFTWCSVADPLAAFAEVRRVLLPHGRLFLLEHVHLAWQPGRRLQSLAAPAWRRVAEGCRLDQDTVGLLESAGFAVTRRRDHLLGWIVEIEAFR